MGPGFGACSVKGSPLSPTIPRQNPILFTPTGRSCQNQISLHTNKGKGKEKEKENCCWDG
jgi:hypothetical protein